MKKTLLLLMMTSLALAVFSQEKKVKTGWKFGGALPAISYDSDLGFQYGALVEFYNYGDGSRYPDYFDHTYTEVSRYTKGSGIYRFMYESNHIIPGVHWSSDLSYLPDLASHFYGFNGYESVFNKALMEEGDPEYQTRMFYRFERNQFRFKNDFQGKLSGDHIKWSAGFAFQNFDISSVNTEKLKVEDVPGLFERYSEWEIIPESEQNGGWVNTVKAGVAWDSRDNRPNPMKGIWTEAGLEAAPGFIGNKWDFAKFYLTHRQYFTLIENDLSFVYRLGYQTTIAGHSPFFYQSQLITSMLTGATSEGLGGFSSLRGVLRNRVIGDGFFYGNLEFRWKPVRFNLFNQDIYIGLNTFYDFGIITNKIDIPEAVSQANPVYFNPGSEKLHQSAGISILPVMNENFVIAVDIGKAFNAQDGNIGFAIGLNYLF